MNNNDENDDNTSESLSSRSTFNESNHNSNVINEAEEIETTLLFSSHHGDNHTTVSDSDDEAIPYFDDYDGTFAKTLSLKDQMERKQHQQHPSHPSTFDQVIFDESSPEQAMRSKSSVPVAVRLRRTELPVQSVGESSVRRNDRLDSLTYSTDTFIALDDDPIVDPTAQDKSGALAAEMSPNVNQVVAAELRNQTTDLRKVASVRVVSGDEEVGKPASEAARDGAVTDARGTSKMMIGILLLVVVIMVALGIFLLGKQ